MPFDIRKVKTELRVKAKAYRASLPETRKQRYDRAIAGRLLLLPCYKNADVVLSYVSTAIEVDTRAIIERALSDGKRVACPRCVDGTRLMNFYYIDSLDDLYPGSFGVLEPLADADRRAVSPENAVCIVPGLAFDKRGMRLGYGKGYYDRYLSSFKGKKIGLCYGECVRERLPSGRFDNPVDILLTERETRIIIIK